jgi:Family of unknown function (DUF6134)
MLLGRRKVLALCAGGVAAGVVGRGPSIAQTLPDYRFRVLRQGSEIGTHTVTFRDSGQVRLVRTAIDLRVRVAFVTAFRFTHESDEEWSAGRLVSLRSSTNDNGTRYEVTGAPHGDGFRTVGPAGPFTMPGNLMTSNAVWTPDFMRQHLVINAKEGGEMGISAKRLAEEVLSGSPGASMTKYRVISPRTAGLIWYGSDGRWLRGVFEVKGETLHYEAI